MTPRRSDSGPIPRNPRRDRLDRVAFGLNGGVFLLAAWDGFESHAAPWSVVLNVLLGLFLLAALLRSRGRPLPKRLPYAVAAVGLFASVYATVGHRSGIPYAFAFAGLLNAVLAVYGPEGLRRLVRRA